MTPTLYSSQGSQHARRVRVLICELELKVDIVEVPYGLNGFGGDDRDGFLRINPNGKVPVLRRGDLVLWESNAIMWYLAEIAGHSSLWPAELDERGQISMWQVWQAAHLTPAADGLFAENFVKPRFLGQASDEGRVAELEQSFHRWLSVMDAALANSEYLACDRFTCADIAVASALMYAESSKMPMDAHRRVAAWRRRIMERPSWAATEPQGGPQ